MADIQNLKALATSEKRKAALSIVAAALEAVDTRRVIQSALSLERNVLRVRERKIGLAKYDRVFVVALGKAANAAAAALEKLLGQRIAGGVVIGTEDALAKRLQSFVGDHPLPTERNVEATARIVELAQALTKDDLVLVVVSGGGSAMTCWPPTECAQGRRLYHDFVRAGASILELNTVRKHLSAIKGGGLAKMLHPAAVIGLIFSDVPGNNFLMVASGPTYRDPTTVADAARILENRGCRNYELTETPKESKYFRRVNNIPLVSNVLALEAMACRGRELGLKTSILGHRFYDPAEVLAQKMFRAARKSPPGSLLLAGGEPEVKVPDHPGRGGRNQHLTLLALPLVQPNQLFISFGTDGRDNGDAAGAIADAKTLAKAARLGLLPADYLARFDSGAFFDQTGDLIHTGPTGANVSDLMLLLTWP